jgi:hypothetical protein
MEADALSTRGLCVVNTSGAGYEAFADALSTRGCRGYIFLIEEVILISLYSFKTPGRDRVFETPGRTRAFKVPGRTRAFETPGPPRG